MYAPAIRPATCTAARCAPAAARSRASNGSCTAWARPVRPGRRAAADALMWAYDPDTAWWPSSWWNSAVALYTLIDYPAPPARTIPVDRAPHVRPSTASRSRPACAVQRPDRGPFHQPRDRRRGLVGPAWVNAYDLTGDARYLDEAVTIANYVQRFWDPSTCGGGVWWDRERTYKNAVTNGLYIRLTAALHNRMPGDTAWLNRAQTGWNWFAASGMINASGLVNDGLTGGVRQQRPDRLDLQPGPGIGAATELWRATGNARLLTTARRLADAATQLGWLPRWGAHRGLRRRLPRPATTTPSSSRASSCGTSATSAATGHLRLAARPTRLDRRPRRAQPARAAVERAYAQRRRLAYAGLGSRRTAGRDHLGSAEPEPDRRPGGQMRRRSELQRGRRSVPQPVDLQRNRGADLGGRRRRHPACLRQVHGCRRRFAQRRRGDPVVDV